MAEESAIQHLQDFPLLRIGPETTSGYNLIGYQAKRPLLVVFDSLVTHDTAPAAISSKIRNREPIVDNIRRFLLDIFNKEHPGKSDANLRKLPTVFARVPCQTNAHDCGLFLLAYFELFFRRPILYLSANVLTHLETWFDSALATEKRTTLVPLLANLLVHAIFSHICIQYTHSAFLVTHSVSVLCSCLCVCVCVCGCVICVCVYVCVCVCVCVFVCVCVQKGPQAGSHQQAATASKATASSRATLVAARRLPAQTKQSAPISVPTKQSASRPLADKPRQENGVLRTDVQLKVTKVAQRPVAVEAEATRRLRDRLAALEKEAREAREQVEIERRALSALQNKQAELEQAHAAANADLAQLRTRFAAEKERTAAEATNQAAAADRRVAELEREKQALQAEARSKEAQVEQASAEADAEVVRLKQHIAALDTLATDTVAHLVDECQAFRERSEQARTALQAGLPANEEQLLQPRCSEQAASANTNVSSSKSSLRPSEPNVGPPHLPEPLRLRAPLRSLSPAALEHQFDTDDFFGATGEWDEHRDHVAGTVPASDADGAAAAAAADDDDDDVDGDADADGLAAADADGPAAADDNDDADDDADDNDEEPQAADQFACTRYFLTQRTYGHSLHATGNKSIRVTFAFVINRHTSGAPEWTTSRALAVGTTSLPARA